MLYSDKSLNHMSCKSNDHSKRRYDRCPVEERVLMGTELSEPIIANKEPEDPYTKYIIHVPSRNNEDSRETQTIATEDGIAQMKMIVENALNMKQTITTIDHPSMPCTPDMDRFKPPQVDCWLL